MNRLILLIGLIIVFSVPTFSQNPIEILDFQLDSLQKKQNLLTKQLEQINNQIKITNIKKVQEITKQELARGVVLYTKKDINVYIERASYSEVVGTLPKNTTIMAFDRQSSYYMIQYDSLVGFVSFMDVETLDQRSEREEYARLQAKKNALTKQRIAEQKQESETKKTERKKSLNSLYGSYNASRIVEGEIWLGMTSKMVVESWGYPQKNNKSVGTWGTREQWVYNSAYLYIINGVLNSYQTR